MNNKKQQPKGRKQQAQKEEGCKGCCGFLCWVWSLIRWVITGLLKFTAKLAGIFFATVFVIAIFYGWSDTMYSVSSMFGLFEVNLSDMRHEAKLGHISKGDLEEWRRYIIVMRSSYEKTKKLQHAAYRDTLPDGKDLTLTGWLDSDKSITANVFYWRNIANATLVLLTSEGGWSERVETWKQQVSKTKLESGLRSQNGIVKTDQPEDVTLGVNSKTSEGYLVCKGTSTKNGYITDVKILAGHASILLGKVMGDNVRKMTENYVDNVAEALQKQKVKDLVVAGHSLGGFRAGFIGTHPKLITAIWRNNGGHPTRDITDEEQASTILKHIKVISFDPVGWASYFDYPAAVQAALDKKLRIVNFSLTAISAPLGGQQAGPVICGNPRYKAAVYGWANAGDAIGEYVNKALGLWWGTVIDKVYGMFLQSRAHTSPQWPQPQPRKDGATGEWYPPPKTVVEGVTAEEAKANEKNWAHQHGTIRGAIEDVIAWCKEEKVFQ